MTAPLPSAHEPIPPLAEVVPFPTRTVPLVTLATAVELVPVSLRMLWVEYLTVGGSADLDRFRAHVDDPADADPEHELVLETLEAVLRDEGVPVRVR